MSIITPTVTAYGASYGTVKGTKLSDYESPLDKDRNNRDEKDVVEWDPFDKTVKDFVKAKLGYPVVDVELSDFQIELCLDEAITKLEYHAPDFLTQYASFLTTRNENVYELPPEVVNNLTDVHYRNDLFGLGAEQGSLAYDFQIMFFTNTGMFNNHNVSQYLLMQQYLKQIKNVLGDGATHQVVNNKYLHVWPVPQSDNETIILEYRALDPATIHPQYKNWIQRYALCASKEILGQIRGKYDSLPGPGGGSKLNGTSLIAEAREDKEALILELTEAMEQPPIFDIF
tara:strand:- start:518 stop:1375 length:858 start_codon:yes stop_codon:yes gene_type:complete